MLTHNDKKQRRKKPEQLTGVLQKSEFSAKLNNRNSTEHLC